MKVGDLVRKMKGLDCHQVGLVLEIFNKKVGHKVISVLSDGKIKNWAAHLVKVKS